MLSLQRQDHDYAAAVVTGFGFLLCLLLVMRVLCCGCTCCLSAVCQLWRFSCPEDSTWWQRIVGLVRQHVPNPDSWRSLISSFSSSDSSTANKQEELQQLHAFLHGSGTRVRSSPSAATQQVKGGRNPVDGQQGFRAAAARLSNFIVKPLQLGKNAAACSSAEAPAWQDFAVQEPQGLPGLKGSVFAAVAADRSCAGGSEAGDDDVAAWPLHWTAEDVAWLSQLVQAEELLETAVHMLLGVGSDSSAELYDKLRAMTRHQGLALEVSGRKVAACACRGCAHAAGGSC
jgi:hypothetical protein